MKKTTSIAILAALLAGAHTAHAAPKFSQGTAIAGAIAYQDDADPAQFHYLPGRIDTTLGVNLKSFKAQYWGIGPTHWAQDSNGQIFSAVGAIISGSANLDITQLQRDLVSAEIKKVYNVTPKLLPVALRNAKVTPILDAQTLSLGNKDVTLSFPSTYAFGTDLQYSIGTGNSLFAQVVGARSVVNGEIQLNPTFGVSIVGEVEFVGDPWRVAIKCDLSQVWKQTRSRVSASVSMGWFRLGSADYQSIQQELNRSGACTFDMKEGELDNEKYGRQIFEMLKKIFDEINKAAVEGDGFFKFEPNPQAGDPGGGGASAWLPWSISVNAGYSEASFKQSRVWSDTVSYTGRLRYVVPTSMILAVSCNTATKAYFADLSNSAEACITQAKIDTFNARLRCEANAKRSKLQEIAERFALGQYTEAQYQRLVATYNRLSFCETLSVSAGLRAAGTPTTLGVQQISDSALREIEEEVIRKLPRRK